MAVILVLGLAFYAERACRVALGGSSGGMIRRLDILAATTQLATDVATNSKPVVKEGRLIVHPRESATLERNITKTMGELLEEIRRDAKGKTKA